MYKFIVYHKHPSFLAEWRVGGWWVLLSFDIGCQAKAVSLLIKEKKVNPLAIRKKLIGCVFSGWLCVI